MDIILERILGLIDESGKSQKDFVTEIGFGRTTVTDWKRGKNNSYGKYVDKIANYFDVDVDYLLGNTDIKKQAHQINGEPVAAELTADEQLLLSLMDNLNDEHRQMMLEYAQFLEKRNRERQD